VPTSWPWNRSSEQPLVSRTGSTVKRDVYKAAAAGVTGLTAFGALAVTGTVAGAAAHEKALQDAQKVVPPAPPAAPQVVEKRRRHHTVVRTRVVHEASAPTVARPATGGTVSTSTSTHSSGSTVTHAAPKPAPKPAPAPAPKPAPKPAPAPAPSSGS
jgi:hypothetical protein